MHGVSLTWLSYDETLYHQEERILMKTRDQFVAFPQRQYRSGLFLLIIAAYVRIFVSIPFEPVRVAVLIGLGLLYTAIGLFGLEYCWRSPSWPITLAYFIFLVIVLVAILFLSLGEGFLLLVPLAAYSIALLPRRDAVAMCGLLLLLLGFVDWRVGDTWVSILLIVLSMLALCVFVVVFTEAVVHEAQARNALGEAHLRLREYAAQIETLATAAERNRLAREIHDDLGHYLTIINVQLEAAQAMLDVDPTRARSAIEKAQKLTRDGLGEIRSSVAALRALPTENRSLPEALTDLVGESEAAGVPTSLLIPGALPQLSSPVKFALYRIAQEGLTNVRKYAHATHVDLTLDGTEEHIVRLSVQDNGVGVLSTTDGFGLLGARERARALGGQIHTASSPGEGFLLEVELPL
jgi:signal transduction histidine kinase